MLHFPVLLEESIGFLVHNKHGVYLDCTFGRGGHSSLILKTLSNKGKLSAFDKDPDAINYANQEISDSRFQIIQQSFNKIDSVFKNNSLDGILFDLGTCSTHFDDKSRGFSFRDDGPLDMRFDFSSGEPLSKWINNASEEEIKEVLFKYGQEKNAKSIAKAICANRKVAEINRTSQLSKIILSVSSTKYSKIHPATKSFQAFRIFINDELTQLEEALLRAKEAVRVGGRIVVISFHSLEDSIVKNSFKPEIESLPKEIPLNPIIKKDFDCLAKKIRPSSDEIDKNKRSRSAIMRVFEKIS
tara:strand:- start:5339 stop:6238 length:900 start_codon:yes stop_codon:yes gene_type:complete